MPIGTGAAIGIGVGLSALNTLGGLAQDKNKYKYWKKSFNYQHEANISDWNMENEYNLPVNQVQRYLQAGINPAYAFGSGMAQGAQISSSQGQQFDLNNLGEKAGQGFVQGLQIAQMASQKENIDADTKLKTEQAKAQQIENNFQTQFGADIRQSGIDLNRAMSGLNDAQRKQILDTLDSVIRKNNAEAQNQEEQAKTEDFLRLFKSALMLGQTNQALAGADLAGAQTGAIPTQLKIGQQNANSNTEQAHAATQNAKNGALLAKNDQKRVLIEDYKAQTERDKVLYEHQDRQFANEISDAQQKAQEKMYDALTNESEARYAGQKIQNEISKFHRKMIRYAEKRGYAKAYVENVAWKMWLETNKVQEEIDNIEANTELTLEQKANQMHYVTQGYMNAAANVITSVGKIIYPFSGIGQGQSTPSNSYMPNMNTQFTFP